VVPPSAAHGVERVFVVPGESYLDMLDGLYDSSIEAVVCRHEGGAAYMAEAVGKLTDTPGVAMVTRGPGAANAHVGLHTAWQDSTAMVLFVGLIPFEHREKEAFQEFDPKAWFETGAKRVMVLDHPERASEIVAEAMFAAQSGRPGPVVVGVPEDILRMGNDGVIHPTIPVADRRDDRGRLEGTQCLPVPGRAAPVRLRRQRLDPRTPHRDLHRLARNTTICRRPPNGAVRALVPFDSPSYVGPIGYGRPKPTYDLLEETDLLVFVGTVPGDVITNGFDIRQNWDQKNFIVTMDPSLRGRSGPVTHQIVSKPDTFVRDLVLMDLDVKPEWDAFTRRMREQQEDFAAPQEARTDQDPATMDAMMAHLVASLPADSMVTFGAGEHTNWAHRYFPTEFYGSMISTRNGSMGYSVPSGVAASLNFPERLVVTIAGDGEFLMNGQELATATQYGATPLVIVMDNQEYGTIRTHQERSYPDRISGTQLTNPDFALMAQAFGGYGARVETNDEISAALEESLRVIREEGRFALIHLVVQQRAKAY
jgi:acetolactate synthase-1/2/3 large subunit